MHKLAKLVLPTALAVAVFPTTGCGDDESGGAGGSGGGGGQTDGGGGQSDGGGGSGGAGLIACADVEVTGMCEPCLDPQGEKYCAGEQGCFWSEQLMECDTSSGTGG